MDNHNEHTFSQCPLAVGFVFGIGMVMTKFWSMLQAAHCPEQHSVMELSMMMEMFSAGKAEHNSHQLHVAMEQLECG